MSGDVTWFDRCQWRRYGQGEQCLWRQGHVGEHRFDEEYTSEQRAKDAEALLDRLRFSGNVVCTIEEWNALHAELAAARAKIAALEARE